jgi:hypothetical protein
MRLALGGERPFGVFGPGPSGEKSSEIPFFRAFANGKAMFQNIHRLRLHFGATQDLFFIPEP